MITNTYTTEILSFLFGGIVLFTILVCYSPERTEQPTIRKSWFKQNPGHVKRFYNYKFKFNAKHQ
jgi:hypothetical protein